VLLVVVDTLRADALGCYGHPLDPTPNMDALAAGGARFEQAIVQGSWTGASMVSMMTGRRLAEERLDIPTDLPTLAESFQAAGWATGGFIMNDIVNAETGFARGFDEFLQMTPYSANDPIAAWVAAHADLPTLTYVHLNEAHDPYLPPEPFRKWVLEPNPLAPERIDYYRRIHAELNLEGDFDEHVGHIEREVSGYVDDVRYTDDRIGRLLAIYEDAGLTERTCVVVTSDHGEGLWTREAMWTGQRRQAQKRGEPPTLVNTLMPTHGNQVSRELVHVPLLIRSAGIEPGTVVSGPVELVDLFPTLLDLCRFRAADGLEGTSLLTDIDATRPSERYAFTHTRLNSSLITPGGWQIIVPTARGICEEGVELELFDLNTDPECRNDLAHEQPELVRALTARVHALWQSGVSGSSAPIPPAVEQAMQDMGYVEIIDTDDEQLRSATIDELLDALETSSVCLDRFASARVLHDRKSELTDEQWARLRALPEDPAVAVRAALERLLGE
jgi:arylsulfatase A-like enzyme